MAEKSKFSSIEKAPLIRKFTILFILMALLPFIFITYIFVQYDKTGQIPFSKTELLVWLFWLGLGSLVGFFGMHHSLVEIQGLAKKTKEILSKSIPKMEEIDSSDSEIAQLSRFYKEVTQSLENNIKRLEASKQTMQFVLTKITTSITSAKGIDTFLELIVEVTANALEAKVGVLMLLDDDKQELYVKAISGFQEEFRELRLKIGEEAPGWVAKHKKPLMIPRLHNKEVDSSKELFEPPLMCVPLLFQERLIGVLAVIGRLVGDTFQEEQVDMAENISAQTAVAVENDRLHMDVEKTYIETVTALAMAVEARDPYSRGHSDRVSDYSVGIAKKLNLNEEDIKNIKDAAELHDVGKIGISDEILRKYTDLDDAEMQIMHKHPAIGESIIKPVRALSNLCKIVRNHHEWLDGTGYPDRLKGEKIPFGAKVLAVADSFDAMTTDRPYHKAMSFEDAKKELSKYINIRYEKSVVEAFLEVLKEMGR